MASPIVFIYSVKKGYDDKPSRYTELAALWAPQEAGAPWGAEGTLNFLPFGSKIVMSKVKLGFDGTPVGGGKDNNSGYGRSGGPRQAAPAKAPAKAQAPADDDAPF